MAGTGILQLPFTLKQSGWFGLTIMLLTGVITNWTGKILVDALYLHPTDPFRMAGYPEIGEAAFGRQGYYFVQIFHKATLFGVSTIFLILSAEFLQEGIGGGDDGEGILSNVFDFESISDGAGWTTIWTVVSAVLVLVPVLVYRTLSENKVLTVLGALAVVICVLVVVIFSVRTVSDSDPLPSHKIFSPILLPSAFSAIVLSFGGAANFPTIENAMIEPKDFGKVCNRAFTVLVVMYVVCASFGYWAFGEETESPILSNLPAHNAVVELTRCLIAFSVITTYPILMNTLVGEVEKKFTVFKKTKMRMLERTSMVAATAIIAIYLPYFPQLMTLVGAGCLTMIVFVCPVVFNFRLRMLKGMKIPRGEFLWGVNVIVVGLLGGTIGVYQAVGDLISAINDN